MEIEEKAGNQPVEKTDEVKEDNKKDDVIEEEVVTLTKAEADALTKAADDAIELATKSAENAENYQKGMMKYKRMLRDNGIDDEDEQKPTVTKEEIAEIVKNTIKESLPELIKPKTEEQNELEQAKTKIEEMRNVIANKKPAIPSSAGANLDKPEPKTDDNYWSPEQIAEIKAKFPNVDPKQVLKNLREAEKGNGMAGNPQT